LKADSCWVVLGLFWGYWWTLGHGSFAYRRRQFRRSIAIRRIKSVLGLQAIIVARVAVAVARVAAAAVAPVAAKTIVVDTIPITALVGHNRGAFQRFNALLRKKMPERKTQISNRSNIW